MFPDPVFFTVRSFSDENVTYEVVKISDTDWRCSCPSWTKGKHRPCKHIESVLVGRIPQKASEKPKAGDAKPRRTDDQSEGQQ